MPAQKGAFQSAGAFRVRSVLVHNLLKTNRLRRSSGWDPEVGTRQLLTISAKMPPLCNR
jgi:hypothetical protein